MLEPRPTCRAFERAGCQVSDTESPESGDTRPFTEEELRQIEEEQAPEYRESWHTYMAPLAPKGEKL